ncbi:MAG TPA: hypothetical protein VHZ81_02205 [Galbitalea sp.]|nr:hypothetical protein [Galbitalea sp.]
MQLFAAAGGFGVSVSTGAFLGQSDQSAADIPGAIREQSDRAGERGMEEFFCGGHGSTMM